METREQWHAANVRAADILAALAPGRSPVEVGPLWLDHSRSFYRWAIACRVLASARCEPLYEDLGIPAPVVDAPAAMHRLAEAVWEAKQGPPGTFPVMPEDPYEEVRMHAWRIHLVERLFAGTASGYGDQAACALADWARRTFADRRESDRWERWYTLLVYLTGVNGRGGPAVPPPLRGGRWTGVLAHISKRLLFAPAPGPDPIKERIKTALAQPRSVWEERVDDRQRFMAGTDDPSGPDFGMGTWLSLTFRAQIAFAIWRDLRRLLTPAEYGVLKAWGHEEAQAVFGADKLADP